ncbi:condensation domain-containing protein (plasmid) [Streptomyces sp. NBC_01298]|uniref:condensation domain-containing protein n=1 Tax=Streptomyces sp. NBC_01298 TaxID=2903817 RepID=UPI002E0F6812|nr:condensation domain-containing protein [Streptomyces sp. NBC_01298]
MWELELRGPLDTGALKNLLGELASGDPGRPLWQHRLLRHGPDHHTLRLTMPEGSSTASVVGRIADLVTRPPGDERPLSPAQGAALAQPRGRRYEAMFIEPGGSLDTGAVREALRAVAGAHPHLLFGLDTVGGRLTRAAGSPTGSADHPDLLVEAEFADEAAFDAAVASVGRTLDTHSGIQLRALLARDRRPSGPCADRLVLIVHEIVVDAASWRILHDDVATLLATGTAGPRTEAEPAPDALARWVAELKDLADDPAEVRHWTAVAGRRSRAAGSLPPAPVTPPGGRAGTTPAAERDSGPGQSRHTGFVLGAGATDRIVHGMAQRFDLTTGQVLTGVFALALARWQGVYEASFDVRSDPRADRRSLRRHVGRLTEPYPVHLTLRPGLGLLDQLAALAGRLATAGGGAAGGAGFGACREWSTDPLVRAAMSMLEPAQGCLVLHDPGEALSGWSGAVNGGAPRRPVHAVEAHVGVADGRLHVGLDWVSGHGEGISETAVAALGGVLRDVLRDLAAASTAPISAVFRATPQQSALYRSGDGRPGTGRHIEQLVWSWRGPLDAERFAAAWQSVFDREAVLRTGFTGGPEPQLMVHSRVAPEITSQVHHGDDWSSLLERDRLRGFDLRRAGALRLTLLDVEEPPPTGAAGPTRIVLTYHRALLDNWSAHILLREFYRAYLAGGTLPGGERRPNLSDYTAWIASQDIEPARGFWARSMPSGALASWPGRPSGATGLTGVGRARLRLAPGEAARLAHWAGTWGAAESSVLQAVWALLIHRASGTTGPAPVSFAVTVSGRGIPLDDVAGMPGPLRNPLPMSVEVDPAGTVADLLRRLRDRVLDMAAYEWVPDEWIRAWSGQGQDAGSVGTVVVFEDPPHPVAGLAEELAAHGIEIAPLGSIPARSVPPIGLLAQHDSAGGLVLTCVYDRDLLSDQTAAELLQQSALLLRELPMRPDEATTVADALKLLEGRAVPPMAQRPGTSDPLVTLRAARQEQAGVICLIPPPGAPASCYDLLAGTYAGPEELLVLTGGAEGAQSALEALGGGRVLTLGGFSGAGSFACEIARRIAAGGGRPPRVVLAGVGADERERARDLFRALQEAVAPVV